MPLAFGGRESAAKKNVAICRRPRYSDNNSDGVLKGPKPMPTKAKKKPAKKKTTMKKGKGCGCK
jgi:hypothetical protein